MTPPDPKRRGPRPLGDALGALFAQKGLARLRSAGELEAAWAEAAGDPAAGQTAVAGVRHGVLTVVVGHPALLEELYAFRKPELLAAMREKAPGVVLHDIRFRVGPIPGDAPPPGPRRRRPPEGG